MAGVATNTSNTTNITINLTLSLMVRSSFVLCTFSIHYKPFFVKLFLQVFLRTFVLCVTQQVLHITVEHMFSYCVNKCSLPSFAS